MLTGPFLGILAGFVVGGLLVKPDVSGRSAPGDGFMIFYCVCLGLVISVLLSALLGIRIWRRSGKAQSTN
jgi:hypothetical protein